MLHNNIVGKVKRKKITCTVDTVNNKQKQSNILTFRRISTKKIKTKKKLINFKIKVSSRISKVYIYILVVKNINFIDMYDDTF